MVGSYFSMKCPDTNWTVRADLPTPPEPSTTTLNSFMIGLMELVRVTISWRRYSSSLPGHSAVLMSMLFLWSAPLRSTQVIYQEELCLISRNSLASPPASRRQMPEIKQFIILGKSGPEKISVCREDYEVPDCCLYLNIQMFRVHFVYLYHWR